MLVYITGLTDKFGNVQLSIMRDDIYCIRHFSPCGLKAVMLGHACCTKVDTPFGATHRVYMVSVLPITLSFHLVLPL